MRQSKVEMYAHLVWATSRRAQLVRPAMEEFLYRCLHETAEELGVHVLAAGGMPDHVHLLVRMPATEAVARLVRHLKGVSSRRLSERYCTEEPFRWQRGYAALSVSSSHLRRVCEYIRGQKERHARNDTWPACEEVDEDDHDQGAE